MPFTYVDNQTTSKWPDPVEITDTDWTKHEKDNGGYVGSKIILIILAFDWPRTIFRRTVTTAKRKEYGMRLQY